MTDIELQNGPRDLAGGWTVDASRGGHNGRVSSEWFARPDDERYLSLSALQAAVTLGKAPIDTPRRAMGQLRGNGVRIGSATDILAAGEGLETVLSVRQAFPALPGIAALSATNLGKLHLPQTLRRVYILRDADPAGDAAVKTLSQRASALGIDAVVLTPSREDFNEDLMAFGTAALRDALRNQLAPEDVQRLLPDRVDR